MTGISRWGPTSWLWAGVFLCVVSIVGFGGLQHLMPDDASSRWGLHPDSVTDLQKNWFGTSLPRVSAGTYFFWQRLLLVATWIGYAMLVIAGLRGGRVHPRWILILIVILALLLGLFCPPTLSTDTYAYAGFARMRVLYGLNPYLNTPSALRERDDPTGQVIHWEIPCVWGPVWLLSSIQLIEFMRATALWWQVMAFKLVESAALVGAALAGRALTRIHDPERADLTLAAIGLNPLFLIEGPINGHNDLLMAALILTSAVLFQKQRDYSGALVMGLATGIKLISVVLIPWLMLASGRRAGGAKGLARALLVAGLVLAPTIVGYLPLWEGTATFTAQRARLHMDGPSEETDSLLLRGGRFLIGQGPIIAIYLGLSLWLFRRGKENGWPFAWAVLALALIFLIMVIPYPWYFFWPLSIALTRWDRWHLLLSTVCCGIGLVVWLMGYTVM